MSDRMNDWRSMTMTWNWLRVTSLSWKLQRSRTCSPLMRFRGLKPPTTILSVPSGNLSQLDSWKWKRSGCDASIARAMSTVAGDAMIWYRFPTFFARCRSYSAFS